MLATLVPATAGADNPEQQTIQALADARPAPDFALHDLDDKLRKLSDFRGHVVAVNFWATWCPPCREELPSMQRTYEAHHDKGFEILGVNVGENWDTVAPFLENFSLTYPIVLDTDSAAMAEWGIMGLPTTFILDRDGRITHRITGGRDWDDPGFRSNLEAIIDQVQEQ
jgi:peroxiredoxin